MGNKCWLWGLFLVVYVVKGCWEEERSALLEVQASMMSSNGGIVWAARGYVDCCFWNGVKCSSATGRVIKLDLGQARLGSSEGWRFNASLFLPFKSLQNLILRQNYILGWTQNEGFDKLSRLTDLKVLDLQYNPLHLNVLSSLCWISSLEVLRLAVDHVFGTDMNHTIESREKCPGLSNLRVLMLSSFSINDIGVLSTLGVGRNLEKLYLDDNSFNATIFSSLKDLSSLNHLNLAKNKMDGTIEMSDITCLTNLESLDLRMNNFEGFVTTQGTGVSSKGNNSLRKLQLGISTSNASKVLHSLKSFSSLKVLSYTKTDLTAPAITYALRNLSTLEYLYLEGSSLNDNFLPSIGPMISLKLLSMAFSGNYGILPNQGWCELINIQVLDFTDNNFEGTLPSCLGNLTSIEWLSLAGNHFTGNVASYPFWRGFPSLEFLDISHTQFEVPLSFQQFSNNSNLAYLDVSFNTIARETEFQNWIPKFQLQVFSMEGFINLVKLPSFLTHQYDLRILAISRNQLSGDFPTWLLENNTRLAGLYAKFNAFIGPLRFPSTSHLHLDTIVLSNNKLNGYIPGNISSTFPKLIHLNISQNLLQGHIPSDVSGRNLQILDLSHNFLSGGVSSHLVVDSPLLEYLRLSHNKLKGKIFPEVDVSPCILALLDLNGNNFEGPLPAHIFLNSLIALDVSNNGFSGEIPRWIRDNTRLLQLDLSRNRLEGSIPVEICNLKLLQVLAISENRLSGSIPSCVTSLPLEHIHLGNNQLVGELDFNIPTLRTLDLGYNSFNGTIPHTIGSLHNLNFLLLNNNQLEGEIPAQICLLNRLSIMDLSFNKLCGPLLLCLGNLTQAKTETDVGATFRPLTSKGAWVNFLFWISSTRHYHHRYAEIHDFILMDVESRLQFSTKRHRYTYKGNFLRYMSGIDLSSNRLTGGIPIEVGNLSEIHALNLSHNHLTGRIPTTFSVFHELESLDLSCNSLNGSIPVDLVELHFLGTFSVANNNLSGAIPNFNGQFGTFDKSSYEGNPFLCGYPLDDCGGTKSTNSSAFGSEESEFDYMESFCISFFVSYGAILLGIAAALYFNPYWRRAWFRLVEECMLYTYYFILDNVVAPFKRRWCRNLG